MSEALGPFRGARGRVVGRASVHFSLRACCADCSGCRGSAPRLFARSQARAGDGLRTVVATLLYMRPCGLNYCFAHMTRPIE